MRHHNRLKGMELPTRMGEPLQTHCVFIVASYWKQTKAHKKKKKKKKKKRERKRRRRRKRKGEGGGERSCDVKGETRPCRMLCVYQLIRATWDVTVHSSLIECPHLHETENEDMPKSQAFCFSVYQPRYFKSRLLRRVASCVQNVLFCRYRVAIRHWFSQTLLQSSQKASTGPHSSLEGAGRTAQSRSFVRRLTYILAV